MQEKLKSGYAIIVNTGAPPGHAVLLRSIEGQGRSWTVSFYEPGEGKIAVGDRDGWSSITGDWTEYLYYKPKP